MCFGMGIDISNLAIDIPNLAERIQSPTLHKNFLFIIGDFSQSIFLNLATQEEL